MRVCVESLGTGVSTEIEAVVSVAVPKLNSSPPHAHLQHEIKRKPLVEIHVKKFEDTLSQTRGESAAVHSDFTPNTTCTLYSQPITEPDIVHRLPYSYPVSKGIFAERLLGVGQISSYSKPSAALDAEKISRDGSLAGRDVTEEQDGGGNLSQVNLTGTPAEFKPPLDRPNACPSMTHSPCLILGVSNTSSQFQHQTPPCDQLVYLTAPPLSSSSSFSSAATVPNKASRDRKKADYRRAKKKDSESSCRRAPPHRPSSPPAVQYAWPPGVDERWGEGDSVALKPLGRPGMRPPHSSQYHLPEQQQYFENSRDHHDQQIQGFNYSETYVRAYISQHGHAQAPSPPICQEFHGRPQPSLVVARPRHHSGDEGLLQGRRLQPQEQFLPFRASPPIFTQAAAFFSHNLPEKQTCSEKFSRQYHHPSVSSGWDQTKAEARTTPERQYIAECEKGMDTSEQDAQEESQGSFQTRPGDEPSCGAQLGSDDRQDSARKSQSSVGPGSRPANVPEIQMTELLSEAEQAAPWMSHTPDNLSPTVQIVQKLSQATVSDSRGLDSPLTSSPASTSPRTHKSMVLQVPTPERSPSLSPPSTHKQKQLFVFPEVGQQRQQPSPPAGPKPVVGASSGSSLEAAGLSVSVASIKSEHLRWRHVSSGSSGDSSTTGEVSLGSRAPPAPGLATSKSTPGGLGSSARHDHSGHARPRHRFSSGDTDVDDTLIDSETGSSIAEEDSGSSREQSPFSGFRETPGLMPSSTHSPGGSRRASPLGRRCSPSSRRPLHRQRVVGSYEDDTEGDNVGGEGDRDEERLQPPKFKRRLHERYVSSLKVDPVPHQEMSVTDHSMTDSSSVLQTFKPSASASPTRVIIQSSSDSGVDIKPTLKLESVSDDGEEDSSSMPKSPRRSFTDESSYKTDSHELSADEGDVFMEPATKFPLPPPLAPHHQFQYPPGKSRIHQHIPLDLSRGPLSPGLIMPMPTSSSSSSFQQHGGMYRSSPGMPTDSDTPTSSPGGIKSAQASPSGQHYSPLYRHSHRLSYSPHGFVSPQSSSQSPLCSVPEGNRIFNFNMPSPYEPSTASSSGVGGGHSDTDIISPSPLSPRFFTFPSIAPSHSVSNTPHVSSMKDVNRLAVSPRALYPTSPPLHSSMRTSSKAVAHVKWENFSKRSFSDSDVAHQCLVCGQAFPSNDNLAKHMAKHLPTETVRSGPDNSKVHYCKICDRSFSRSDMLTRHMRLHTGLKPYECIDCGQVFSRSDHLNTHKRTHTGEKPYRCPHCPYAACRRDMITRHMRTHSAGKRSTSHTHQGKRGRFLSMPDDGSIGLESASKPSKSTGSSADTLEGVVSRSQAHSSLSSIDSLDLEVGHSQHRYPGERSHLQRHSRNAGRDFQTSLESMTSLEGSSSGQPRTSSSSRESEDPEEFMSTFPPSHWIPSSATVPHASASTSFIKGVGVGHQAGVASYQEPFPSGAVTSASGSLAPVPSHHVKDDNSSYFQDKQQQQRVRVPSPHPRGYFYPHAPPSSTSHHHQYQQHHPQQYHHQHQQHPHHQQQQQPPSRHYLSSSSGSRSHYTSSSTLPKDTDS
ncbi:hypothetical protein PoB_001022700 [Plakobranchus ocellatus]|uniref:C2H2-type domain-containing protein n=1 Tax=Plakobranchus ocellatus TaxID=259542 RepID=A0AAV3YNM0_9GAST|nr:hypothetical protein PoB_001022700 [Plakobranchus ocellatus]